MRSRLLQVTEWCCCAVICMGAVIAPARAQNLVVEAVEVKVAPAQAAKDEGKAEKKPEKEAKPYDVPVKDGKDNDKAPKDETSKKDGKAEKDNAAKDKKPTDAAAAKDEKPKPKTAAVVRRRAVAPQPVQPVNAAKAMEQQFHRLYEPALKVELSFAIRAADLNEEERKAVIEAGKKWFEKYVSDFAKNQNGNQQQMFMQGGGQVVWFGGGGERPENPRDVIRTGVAKTVTRTIEATSKEKAKTFAEECKKRDEFFQKTSIDNLVAQVDERVILSPDQRKKATDLLSDHWEKNKNKPQIEAFAMGNGSMWAGVTDAAVLGVLSKSQRAVLDRQNSVNGQVMFGGGMFGGNNDVIDDFDLGYEHELGAGPQAAPAMFIDP